MVRNITQQKWDAMTPVQLMIWAKWAMPQGEASPIPGSRPVAQISYPVEQSTDDRAEN